MDVDTVWQWRDDSDDIDDDDSQAKVNMLYSLFNNTCFPISDHLTASYIVMSSPYDDCVNMTKH